MSSYAAGTQVPIERSQQEIERDLKRFGASEFAYGWSGDSVMIAFTVQGRRVRIGLRLGDTAPERKPGSRLGPAERLKREQQRRMRALSAVVKAKLVAVQEGITTIEREFLADTVMASGQTVSEWAGPQLAAMFESGRMPALLPGMDPREIAP